MKRSSIGFIAFLVVAIGLVYGVSRLTSRLSKSESSLPPVSESSSEVQKTSAEEQGLMFSPSGTVKGPEDAKVKVVAVIPPSECQAAALRVLNEIAKAEPKRVRIEVYGMGSPKGSQILQQYGATCASIFINGKKDFTLTSEGQTRRVICEKSPGMSYQATDLIEIVHMELKRQYGKGFDEKTLKQLREKGRQIVGGGHGVSGMESSKAKVVVEVLTPAQQGTLYPLFAETVKVLERLKERFGDDLSVVVNPVATAEGQKRIRELNLNGPAVVINGKTVHEIPGPNNTKRKIVTAYGAGGRLFTPSEIAEVVVAYMKQAKK